MGPNSSLLRNRKLVLTSVGMLFQGLLANQSLGRRNFHVSAKLVNVLAKTKPIFQTRYMLTEFWSSNSAACFELCPYSTYTSLLANVASQASLGDRNPRILFAPITPMLQNMGVPFLRATVRVWVSDLNSHLKNYAYHSSKTWNWTLCSKIICNSVVDVTAK